MKREVSSIANGRVNLLGEHLDYNGGAVLPLQIDKCVRIYLSDNTNEEIVIKSKQYDEKIIINHNLTKQENWSDFVVGACKIISDKSKITIFNLDYKKRPISAVADNIEIRNAKTINIKTNNKIKFNLLYDSNSSLQKKIKLEQLRKETN